MPLEIKNILYATDLSRNAAYAFRYAVDLAKNHSAEIYPSCTLSRGCHPLMRQ